MTKRQRVTAAPTCPSSGPSSRRSWSCPCSSAAGATRRSPSPARRRASRRPTTRDLINRLHACGSHIHFDEFADYPVTACPWATVPGNPGLDAMHVRTGRAVAGPAIATMTADARVARARRATEKTSGRWLLLGTDCSINPATPEPLLAAVGEAVRAGR